MYQLVLIKQNIECSENENKNEIENENKTN